MTHLFLIIFFAFLAVFLTVNLLARYILARRRRDAERQADMWNLQRSAD